MITNELGSVTFKGAFGNDLEVVNTARVSFAKESSWVDQNCRQLSERDQRLIYYLAKHQHWSPFASVALRFVIKAPIFVARQLGKHQVGFAWNEVSRRYVDVEPELYVPKGWRIRAKTAKQGSQIPPSYTHDVFWHSDNEFKANEVSQHALLEYNSLLQRGVCPEQARMILPQNMMTEWRWMGSLYGFARVYQQRVHHLSQYETSEVVRLLWTHCEEVAPVSCAALKEAMGAFSDDDER